VNSAAEIYCHGALTSPEHQNSSTFFTFPVALNLQIEQGLYAKTTSRKLEFGAE
jgi:hypothetical protein